MTLVILLFAFLYFQPVYLINHSFILALPHSSVGSNTLDILWHSHNLKHRMPVDRDQDSVISTTGDSDDELPFVVCYCILKVSVLRHHHSR